MIIVQPHGGMYWHVVQSGEQATMDEFPLGVLPFATMDPATEHARPQNGEHVTVTRYRGRVLCDVCSATPAQWAFRGEHDDLSHLCPSHLGVALMDHHVGVADIATSAGRS